MHVVTFRGREECIAFFWHYHGAVIWLEDESTLFLVRDSSRGEPGYTFVWVVDFGVKNGPDLAGYPQGYAELVCEVA